MKNTILFLISCCISFLIMFACNETDRGQKAPQSKRLQLDSTSSYSDQNYRTYTLEGCEYIVVGSGKDRWGSHKGNCKNSIHSNIDVCETTDSTIYQEKHFDCYVEDCYFDKQMNSYAITTECGILFYGKSKYKKNEVLKNFKSPKHE
jgi:hypothetical protein